MCVFFTSAEHLRQHSYVLHINIVQQIILKQNTVAICYAQSNAML